MQHINYAKLTLTAIEDAIHKDQGAKYRGWLGKVIGHIGDAYREDEDGHRSHMGASLIGKRCSRAIWYNFHWATKSKFSGRMLRLFNRGHLEEARFIAMLLTIGVQVFQQDENGKQFRISHSQGHFGGSGDGILLGLPDLPPGTPALGEFKTHNAKSFKKLVDAGVRDAKPEHYIQMQMYMRKMGFAVALYLAVNKDTDELHGELVYLNAEVADQYLDRAHTIIWLKKPPEKISTSTSFFDCKYCDHLDVCQIKYMPDVNCRTCKFSEPVANAQWYCSKHAANIPKEVQLKGCANYSAHEVFG